MYSVLLAIACLSNGIINLFIRLFYIVIEEMDVFATSEGTITQLKVRNQSFILKDTLLLTYKSDGAEVNIKAPSEGIVRFAPGVNRNLAVDEVRNITTSSNIFIII